MHELLNDSGQSTVGNIKHTSETWSGGHPNPDDPPRVVFTFFIEADNRSQAFNLLRDYLNEA